MPARLTYHVATTLDGRIAHPDGTWAGFVETGSHVDAFLRDVEGYSAVLMGRKTYEAGLAAGLPPGQPAYPGRPNYVYSRTLSVPSAAGLHVVDGPAEAHVRGLKTQLDGTVWLCGGGELAGALLEAGLVDALVLKLNPVLFGAGRPVAAGLTRAHRFRLTGTEPHDTGVVVLRYALAR